MEIGVTDLSTPVVGFVGMSHLGLVSSTAAALRGFPTVAFDPSPDLISRLSLGDLPVLEPGLDEAVARAAEKLSFTSDPEQLATCDIVYISIDVPTDATGTSDLSPIRVAVDLARAHVHSTAAIIVLSQVTPGFTREVDWPSALTYYQVETLVFGQALQRAMEPERLIVGMADAKGTAHPAFWHFLESFGCPIHVMGYESAELAKVAVNAMLVATISAANTMAEICERIGADWTEIVPALRLDRRIGDFSYIHAGLGLTGGNLERDVQTIIRLAQENGTDQSVPRAWVESSVRRRNWVHDALVRIAGEETRELAVGNWGLAYKENTDSTKNSVSVNLIRNLGTASCRWFDPVVNGENLNLPGQKAASALEAASGADVLCVMTPWGEFSAVSAQAIVDAMRGNWVIDPWGRLDPDAMSAVGARHLVLGRSAESRGKGSPC